MRLLTRKGARPLQALAELGRNWIDLSSSAKGCGILLPARATRMQGRSGSCTPPEFTNSRPIDRAASLARSTSILCGAEARQPQIPLSEPQGPL